MLYNIIILPIETIVSWIFNFSLVKLSFIRVMGAVCAVSLAINFLALPLYNIADSLQAKERKIAKALEYRVKRIKKAFKGDEQFMMLSEYYRQNNYHPLYVLRSSLSILIEIPFFIAAYHFLSHNQALIGSSFWIFRDLGAPDKLIRFSINGTLFYINILPVLMTLINFISRAVYLKECPAREKIQLYGIAIIFLVLLYNSPSGLVIYWILNNLFSLVKNIVLKTQNPGKFVYYFFSALLGLTSAALIIRGDLNTKKIVFILFSIFVISLHFISRLSNIKETAKKLYRFTPPHNSNLSLLLISGTGLTLLAGLVLPANSISTSPIEFSFLGNTDSPLSYIVNSIFTFSGFFIFWPVAIYKMFGEKLKKLLPFVFFNIFIIALLNVFLFKYNYGNINIAFELERTGVLRNFKIFFTIIPLIVFLLMFLLSYLLVDKKSILHILAFSLCLAEVSYGLHKTLYIKKAYKDYISLDNRKKEADRTKILPIYKLSKTDKNVVVLFIDRAINSYFPKIMEQFPELVNSFSGFIYYPNTVSYSTNTFQAYPAMTGGYEYTLENLKRDKRLLRDKFAEASLVQPKLFSDAGWNVTMSDIVKPDSYADDIGTYKCLSSKNYVKANSIYNEFYSKKHGIVSGVSSKDADKICKREIINFSVLQMLYPPVRITFYNNMTNHAGTSIGDFINNASTLDLLCELTDFSSEKPSYIFIENELTHSPTELDDSFLLPGNKSSTNHLSYYPNDVYDQRHYDVNVCTYKLISNWISFLKENNVYDNTRIIIVSDHGRDLNVPCFNDDSLKKEKAYFHPVLLFKDFNSNKELAQDNSFMTNADTLFLAKQNLGLSDKNPFTGKSFEQDKKNGVNIFMSYRDEYMGDGMREKSSFTLLKEIGFFVHDDIFQKENWEEAK
ncbi:membrane protein insertase YidC [uncultured Treponema sp.]|uniref:YidC/Oxa1 family membrane protein insertase n=1 Tax=uncultured Treponema sp. TaxID=162155 RepID=UPI00262526D8|nr:membrane protein insertase YidC [uncultured Treponema sp.]